MTHVLDSTLAPPVPMLKIGQLALRSGLTPRNLRFYADAGVFGVLPRSPKGYRLFPPEAVHWVQILRAGQAAGFALEEVALLLRSLRQDGVPCAQVRVTLGDKLRSLEAKQAEVNLLVDILHVTLATPDGRNAELGCDLMQTLLAQAARLPARSSRLN